MNTVEKAIKQLLDNKPFYAYFFLNSRVEYDTHNVKTAAACSTSSGPLIIFNTEFFSTLTLDEVGSVIEHEVLHLLFQHTVDMEEDDSLHRNIANIAMDCSINQYIGHLPKGGVTLDGVNKELNLSLLPEQAWEYYYENLVQKAKELQGKDSFDDHLAGEGEPGQQRATLRAAAEKSLKSAAGVAPSQVLKALDGLKPNHTVPWQQVLSNFVAKSTACTTKNTRKKTNRRFGVEQPGKVKKRELVLGVCVDSSGSVSDEAFSQFMAEVARISSLCSITYLVDADCVVQSVKVIKKNAPVVRERNGNGGTAYQPAIDECKRRRCDAIIYFGDFDCADTPTNPGVPFLWVGVGNSPKPGDFGAEIRL